MDSNLVNNKHKIKIAILISEPLCYGYWYRKKIMILISISPSTYVLFKLWLITKIALWKKY